MTRLRLPSAAFLLLAQLSVWGWAGSCPAGGCGTQPPAGSSILPACCCDPGTCGDEITGAESEPATLPSDAALLAVVMPSPSSVFVSSHETMRAPTSGGDPAPRAPPLYLLHSALLI